MKNFLCLQETAETIVNEPGKKTILALDFKLGTKASKPPDLLCLQAMSDSDNLPMDVFILLIS